MPLPKETPDDALNSAQYDPRSVQRTRQSDPQDRLLKDTGRIPQKKQALICIYETGTVYSSEEITIYIDNITPNC